MKKPYLAPTIINANNMLDKGIAPLVVAGVTIKSAAALLAGYAAGRAVAKAVKALPSFKLPNLKPFGGVDSDICLA
ncbi:MAG: hypothetical protein J6O04_08430 [Selenomonadaceae bacterium]|nr:hypothetical protein [Selenomonadaceae bacterium]